MRTKPSRRKWLLGLSVPALEERITVNEARVADYTERIRFIDSGLPLARSLEMQHDSLQRQKWALESQEIDSITRSVVALFDDTKRRGAIQKRDSLEAQRPSALPTDVRNDVNRIIRNRR